MPLLNMTKCLVLTPYFDLMMECTLSHPDEKLHILVHYISLIRNMEFHRKNFPTVSKGHFRKQLF